MLHQEMVTQLKKSGEDILRDLSPELADLVHMAIGVAGEAGELLDAVKKAAIYNKPLDIDNVIEELGDIEFYMEGLRQNRLVNISREETLQYNITKLGKRYKGHRYSDEQAQTRVDKG